MIEVTIPPPKNVSPGPSAAQDPTARDWDIAEIATRGRMAWQEATGYIQRSRGETVMGRQKAVIGSKIKARPSKVRKQDRRPSSQPDDRAWPPAFRTHRLKSVSSRARFELQLICATRPKMTEISPADNGDIL